MKGIPVVINFSDPSLPGKKRFVVKPQTTDGPATPTSTELDAYAKEAHTSLVLPGMGLLEYGERVNQDLVHLLERFAGEKEPMHPTIGQHWFDSVAATTKVWDGDMWVAVGGNKKIATYLDYNALVALMNDALKAPAIGKPENRTPAEDAIGVDYSPTFSASEYMNRYGTAQDGAQWQCATNEAFSAPLMFDVYKSGPSVTLAYADKLSPNSKHFFRVRYKDAQGAWSEWSTPTHFTTKQASLLAPIIVSPSNGAINQAQDLTLTSSTIAVDSGSEVLASCDWEIWTGPNGSGNKVFSQYAHTSLNMPIPAGTLDKGVTYYARLRHNGATLGASPWSLDCAFTTVRPTVNTPSVTSPASGAAVSGAVQLVGSDLSIDGATDTLARSIWEIRTGPNGTGQQVFSQTAANSRQTSVPDGVLQRGSTYYVHVTYVTDNYGTSPVSADVQFSVANVAAGTVLRNYCTGTSYMAQVADGNGGSYERVEQTNSAQCGYVAPPSYPAAGTVLATHCVGTVKYNTVADGTGGSTEQVVEYNSTSCGYVAPSYPAAGTILGYFCQGYDRYQTVANGSGGSNNQLLQTNSQDCGYVAPLDLSSIPLDITSNVASYSPMADGSMAGASRTQLALYGDGTWQAIWAYAPGAYRKRSGRFRSTSSVATNFEYMIDNATMYSTFGNNERTESNYTPGARVGTWYPLSGATWSTLNIDGSTPYPIMNTVVSSYYDDSGSYEGYTAPLVFVQLRHTFRLNIRDKTTQQIQSINITMNAVGNANGPRAGYTTTP